MSKVEVLIVGAGPTGLTAAIQLLRTGIKVRLIDKALKANDKSRALGIQPRTMELFEMMGIVEPFLKETRVTHLNLSVKGKKAFSPNFDHLASSYNYLTFVEQYKTEKHLEKKLLELGGEIERGVELRSFTQNSHGVKAFLVHNGKEEEVNCDYLIGADGAHSTVRGALGANFDGDQYEQEFSMADVKLTGGNLASDQVDVMFFKKGAIVTFPMEGENRYRITALRPEHPTLDSLDLSFEEFTQTIEEICPNTFKMSDPTWVTKFRLHHRNVREYCYNRVFLCGDSAHIHSPLGGQGMNTGIQDALNLAWKLDLVIKGHAKPEFLKAYHEERHPIGMILVKRTDRMFKMASAPNKMLLKLRNFLAPTLGKFLFSIKSFHDNITYFISQLKINYKNSSIVTNGNGVKGAPKAGHRFPNATVKTHEDKSASLYSCFKEPGHHLFAFCTQETDFMKSTLKEVATYPFITSHVITLNKPTKLEKGNYYDPEGAAHKVYEALEEPSFILVRPDGYIAYRGLLTSPDGLFKYLDKHYAKN